MSLHAHTHAHMHARTHTHTHTHTHTQANNDQVRDLKHSRASRPQGQPPDGPRQSSLSPQQITTHSAVTRQSVLVNQISDFFAHMKTAGNGDINLEQGMFAPRVTL